MASPRLRTMVVAALGLAPLAANAVGYSVVDLGTLGGRNAYAAAVSQGGRVSGCAETASGEIHAFVWYGGVMRDLGRGAEAAGNSCALAVNDNGMAAGRASSGEIVLWKDGGATPLGFPGDVGGMNLDGVVVGARQGAGSTRPFIYRDGVVTELGGPAARGEAAAVNARGQVVGTLDGRAFVYENGTVRDLGTLGGNTSAARDINASGAIVGQASNEFGQPTAFLHDGSMRALPGPTYSSAVAISASGRVAASGEGTHGYVVSSGTVTPLGEVPSVVALGWRNVEPTAMNDRGWIVGTAENAEGDLRAFLLLPSSAAKPRRPGSR